MDKKPDNIRVEVQSQYVPWESNSEELRFVFAYTVTIFNEGERPAQLLTRHWLITDANGKIHKVEGEGVVGEQPFLRAGEGFQYTSSAVLRTPVGSMEGSFTMINEAGKNFDAEIEPFTLAIPEVLH